jgi:hypothetical protein
MQWYNKTLDVIINCIQEIFDQLGYQMYSSLESLLFTAAVYHKHTNDDAATMTLNWRSTWNMRMLCMEKILS